MAHYAEERSCITQFELGELFHHDQGSRDYGAAFKWYFRAAKNGHRRAQHRLGGMFAKGQGVARNLVKAYAWCLVATMQSSRRAEIKLARIGAHMSRQQIAIAEQLAQKYFEIYVALPLIDGNR